jgi:hypothetical protein
MTNTHGDFRDAANFENDFGPTPEGRLLKQLDTLFSGKFGEDYAAPIRQIYQGNKELFEARAQTHPTYAIALLNVASIIGDQDMFDRHQNTCFQNDLVWGKWEGENHMHRILSVKRWINNATSEKHRKCNMLLKSKLFLHKRRLLKGDDPHAYSDIESIGLNSHYRQEALEIMAKGFEKYPDDAFIATSLVVLTEGSQKREDLAFKMYERFPNHGKLGAITEDVNVGKPNYTPPKRRTHSPLYD